MNHESALSVLFGELALKAAVAIKKTQQRHRHANSISPTSHEKQNLMKRESIQVIENDSVAPGN
jgi:hypothetical protein